MNKHITAKERRTQCSGVLYDNQQQKTSPAQLNMFGEPSKVPTKNC